MQWRNRLLVPPFAAAALLASLSAPASSAAPHSGAAAQLAAAPRTAAAPAAVATPAGSADVPPMGWNSWNKFQCSGLNATVVKQMADAIVSRGMDRLGYRYVNLDDCWMAPQRDQNGNLQADPQKFPLGIKDVADYVHAKGLKLGIYSAAKTYTCAGRPGSLGHETQDAKLFASYGADLLKYDICFDHSVDSPSLYTTMGNALKATGRPIVFSLCNQGLQEPWRFGPETGGSLWRTTDDINDSWNSMIGIADQQAGLETFAGPNRWNDPDMLEVGNGGMTTDQYKVHFSLWSLLNAPLILGNDLRSMDATTQSILTNADLIAVNQDWSGAQGRRIRDDGEQEIWAKTMSDGSVVVALLNRNTSETAVSTTLSEIGLSGSASAGLKDLWSKAVSSTTGTISATVPATGVVVYRVTRAGNQAAGLSPGVHQIGDLPWAAQLNGWGPVERNGSNGEQAAGDGRALTIGSTTYAKGVGTHAMSGIHVVLGRKCSSFTSAVGIDAESGGQGSVRFAVYGDGRLLAAADRSGGQGPTTLSASVSGVADLELRVTDNRDGINYDHADWGGATVTC
jgi:alpha-galactosidase